MGRAPLWIVGLVLAAPTLFARFPPMSDLPLHEAVVGVLRHLGNPAYFPAGLYRLNLGHPNQAFYLFAWLVSLVVSVPLACKVVVAGAIAALPAAAARLARYLEKPEWLGLLVAPIGIGWLYFWGVVANIVGLVFLLALLPVIDAALEQPSLRNAARVFAALLVLYTAHEAMLLVGCVAVGLFAVVRPLEWRATALRLAALVPIFLLCLLQLVWQEPLRTANNRAIPLVIRPLWHKVANIPGVICYLPSFRAGVAFCAFVPVAWLLVRRLRQENSPTASRRESLCAHRFELLAGALLGLYLAFPHTLVGATLVYHRFLAPAYAIGVIALAPRGRTRDLPFVLRATLVASPLAALIAIVPACFESNRLYADFERLLDHVDYGSSYMAVDLDPVTDFQPVHTVNLEGHAVALRGGRSVHDITQSPISPAIVGLDHRWSESSQRLQMDRGSLALDYDLRRYRYLFVHASDPGAALPLEEKLRGFASFVAMRGAWVLFRSDLPEVPISAPDGPPPPAAAETLR
jgi:hypothetical protein